MNRMLSSKLDWEDRLMDGRGGGGGAKQFYRYA